MTKLFFQSLFCTIVLSYSSVSFAVQNKMIDTNSIILSQSLTPQVSVSGEMSKDKFKKLINQGFKSVIVNRPDQELGNHIPVHELRNIAEQAHISVIYQPIISGKISPTDVTEFAKYYNELPKPILMICRSGTRSAALFNQANKQGLLHE